MIDDELRATSVANNIDRNYVYDKLGRVVEEKRGSLQLSNSHPGTWRLDPTGMGANMGAGSRQWGLDELGNWKSDAQDTNGNFVFASGEESDRTHDKLNQYKTASAAGTVGTADYRPALSRDYDDNGNLVLEKHGPDGSSLVNWERYSYDAWNRLVRVETWDTGTSAWLPLAQYQYNSLNWRTQERQHAPSTATAPLSDSHLNRTRLYYYSKDWQVLQVAEDDQAPNTTDLGGGSEGGGFVSRRETQYFYGLRNVDDVIMRRTREKSPATGEFGSWFGSPREYLLTDANFSVVAITNGDGIVTKRVDYDAYGTPTLRLTGDMNDDGRVDDADFSIFTAAYDTFDCADGAMPAGEHGNSCPADLNEDGYVDDVDFGLFEASYDTFLAAPVAGPLYSGYWYDEGVGFYNCRNRWFDSIAGRWLTRDPAGYVDGMSLYL